MRQAILFLAFAVAVPLGLLSAQLALLSYIGFSLSRPDLIAWSYLPYGMVLGIIALVSSLRLLGNTPNLLRNPFSALLLAQHAFVGLSVLTAVHFNLATPYYYRYFKISLMCMLIPIVITTETWLRRLMITIVFSMGLIAVKFGLFSLVYGGTALVKGLGGLIGDSNGLALFMVMLLPVAWSSMVLLHRSWQRLAVTGILICSITSVISTGSRGNSLAMVAVLFLLVMRSKYKTLAIAGAVALSIPALYLAGERYTARMSTIQTYEEDQSAANRLDLWKASLKTIRDYPIFGVGYGEKNWIEVSPKYLGKPNRFVVHNTYLQMAVDCGIPLFLLYTGTLIGAVLWLQGSISRMKHLNPAWLPYPAALQGGLISFCIGSTFYSRGDFEFMYMLLATTGTWYLIEKDWLQQQAALQRQQPAGADPDPHLPAPAPAMAGAGSGGSGAPEPRFKFGGRRAIPR